MILEHVALVGANESEEKHQTGYNSKQRLLLLFLVRMRVKRNTKLVPSRAYCHANDGAVPLDPI